MTIGSVTLIALIMITGFIIGQRTRREARLEEARMLSGARRVCKLSTVELPLADYAKKAVAAPAPGAPPGDAAVYLFYSGVVSAGFDGCDAPGEVTVDHAGREVRVALPAPRVLSVDVLRFESVNQASGFLDAVAPAERSRWFADARAALQKQALAAGLLERAQSRAHQQLADYVEPRGYRLRFSVAAAGR
jgi:hypothetical protein